MALKENSKIPEVLHNFRSTVHHPWDKLISVAKYMYNAQHLKVIINSVFSNSP